ncbi:RNAPII degradation factor [Coniosporium apollinis]|uniref:RNA polymerase II degradation factor 1 n=2 Tax=Coniosporium TaxID=2810619 RepID=A0ABQ9NMS5_9PEZI|nr:RNAPII degradation factor [Cladosporium sp. JES 115]KAJ9662257.1 RNAPII degradation factor [Coniosporium apollinis]
MSEVQTRPAASRGRSSARGGRGGYRGAPRTAKQTNGDLKDTEVDTSADQGELGELKKKYSSQLSVLKELFPAWTDVDLVLALQESDGDLQSTIERITEGNVSQFSEVPKKTKDRSRSKVKEGFTAGADTATASSRPARGRGGPDSARGARGRPERGRGGFRGGRGGTQTAANGARPTSGPTSVPTTDSTAWETSAPTEGKENDAWDTSAAANTGEAAPEAQWGSTAASTATPATASEGQKSSLISEGGAKKTWASMFAKPKPAPAAPKVAAMAPPLAEVGLPPTVEVPEVQEDAAQVDVEPEALPVPPVADEAPEMEPPTTAVEPPQATPEAEIEEAALQLTPSKDELTEDNLEHLPDASVPAPTETAASTVASSRDIGVATPLPPGQQPPISRPPMGGFATSAFKATGAPGRSASFQRRIMEQQEAVVMPGNHAVDRAAVQFGSMGLNGDADLDVDDDREEPETRTQPPQQSPAAPRASLPPATRQPSLPSEAPVQDTLPTPKQAGLPPVPQQQQQTAQQHSPQNTLGAQVMPQQTPHGGPQYSQYGRYDQPILPSEQSAPLPKAYDPFSQQTSRQSHLESYPSQQQSQIQQQTPSQLGGFSSAPPDHSSYYTSDQTRNAYGNFYGAGYGQQGNTSQQDAGASQQRTGSAFGTSAGDSAYPTSQSQQVQSRYGEAQNSGHNTPNPTLAAQQHTGAQSQQAQHLHQQPYGQSGYGYGGYPNHPYYNSPYYAAYMNQSAQHGYGGPFGGKGGMYGQPHHGYGMSPQTSHDQYSSSPAAGGFGASSMHGRDTGLTGGLGEYSRSGSTQPTQISSQDARYSGMSDPFGRSASGFPGQSQGYGQQQSAHQGGTDPSDALKPFGSDAKSGPSPSALGQPGRPGSATNNTPGVGSQSGLPPPQSHQQGFGGYPGHLGGGQGSQYGGFGGLGAHQSSAQNNQAGGYGGYGSGFSNYGGSYGRGGWGGNYTQH